VVQRQPEYGAYGHKTHSTDDGSQCGPHRATTNPDTPRECCDAATLVAGAVTNLAAGVAGAKWGIRATLISGLTLQIVGLGGGLYKLNAADPIAWKP
jgi:hypothetical protein